MPKTEVVTSRARRDICIDEDTFQAQGAEGEDLIQNSKFDLREVRGCIYK